MLVGCCRCFFINIILIRLMLILKLLIMSKHLMPGPDVPLAMCQLCTAGNFSTYRKPRQLHTILLGMPLSKDKGAGAFHSAGQSKEGLVGFGTSKHPIFMKLLPDHLWH